eukprot:m.11222 g.11222  ORF g.11222 m.11222 type:complete len:112 (-) comp4402_c0_seq1:155-490(-)
MVVAIRLARSMGHRHRPFYRIVVADKQFKRDGRFLERVGTYDPLPTREGAKYVTLDIDRIKYWIAEGAQPTERVSILLGKAGILPPWYGSPNKWKTPEELSSETVSEDAES